MAQGGARNRSGPSKDPNALSAMSRPGLRQLPAEGFRGALPPFPLPAMVRQRWEAEGQSKYQVTDDDATSACRDRELEIWDRLWQSPQAVAWASEPWRQDTIAEYARIKTIVEMEPDGSASLVAQLHRYRDQIGFSPAGLKENGWAIAAPAPETGARPVDPEQAKVVQMFANGDDGS